MKKILLTVFAFFAVFNMSTAQVANPEQDKKELKTVLKQTEKQQKAAMKDAKKQVKALEKDGWKPVPGSATLEKQYYEMNLKRNEMDGSSKKYIIGLSSAKAGSYGVARRQAMTRAKLEIASNIKAAIAALTKNTEANVEQSNGEVVTSGKTNDVSMQLVQQSIGVTDVIFEIYREKDNQTEVQIGLAYDGNTAKANVLEQLSKENKELEKKLEKLLQKQSANE